MNCAGTERQPTPTFHAQCDAGACRLHPLFFLPTRFSFGRFLNGDQSAIRTRVGLDRTTHSATLGVLLSTEVRYGQFVFDVMLPDADLYDPLYEAVSWAGTRPDQGGIGRFRSAGWGQFRVRLVDGPRPWVASISAGSTRYRFRFRTPYVLSASFLNPAERAATLQADLQAVLPSELAVGVQVTEVELRLRTLFYVRRWVEPPPHLNAAQRKENRQVAGPDTELVVTFSEPVTAEQLSLWPWGIGEWAEAGFGCADVRDAL
jgi:hypothetical protein